MTDPLLTPAQACANCAHYIDYRCPDDEPNEVDGYCSHPDHSDPAKSPHHEYGGHWTREDLKCEKWEGLK